MPAIYSPGRVFNCCLLVDWLVNYLISPSVEQLKRETYFLELRQVRQYKRSHTVAMGEVRRRGIVGNILPTNNSIMTDAPAIQNFNLAQISRHFI
jgi:hypothetical protein